MNYQISILLIYLCSLSNNASQQQLPALNDDALQSIIITDLQSMTGKELNHEIARLSRINKQYNRVMHRSAVIQLIIKKTLEPILVLDQFEAKIKLFSKNPNYATELKSNPIKEFLFIKDLEFIPTKKDFDAEIKEISSDPQYKALTETQDFKNMIAKKNMMFDIIINQIQPKLTAFGINNIINRKGGINTIVDYEQSRQLLSYLVHHYPQSVSELIEKVLSVGANPNSKDKYGATALWDIVGNQFAPESGRVLMAKSLLQFGADPNLANNEGRTPLMRAAKIADAQAVELLLQYRANPLATIKKLTGDGTTIEMTARDIAEYEKGFWENTHSKQASFDKVISILADAEKKALEKNKKPQ